MPSERQSKCGVRGRTELDEWVSTTNWNKHLKEGRPTGLRRGGKVTKGQLLVSSHRGRGEVDGER